MFCGNSLIFKTFVRAGMGKVCQLTSMTPVAVKQQFERRQRLYFVKIKQVQGQKLPLIKK